MKRAITALLAAIILSGCATFKELTPKPEIQFKENGYLQIRDDDENFELETGKKYFMMFPAPLGDNTYLVMDVKNRQFLSTYFTDLFDDGEKVGQKYINENASGTEERVFAISPLKETYFWVIEDVKADMKLEMNYRYVAIWRYKFENRKTQMDEVLAINSHNRDVYKQLGESMLAENIPFDQEIEAVQTKYDRLASASSELEEIAAIFPSSITGTNDEAYADFLQLKNTMDEEMSFQSDYLRMLTVLESAANSKSDMSIFMGRLEDYLDLLNKQDRYPENVLNASKTLFRDRLRDVYPYYVKTLRNKNDIRPIDFDSENLTALFAACEMHIPTEVNDLQEFVSLYNARATQYANVEEGIQQIRDYVDSNAGWPRSSLFREAGARLSRLQNDIPAAGTSAFRSFSQYDCVDLLSKKISGLRSTFARLTSQYRRAGAVVSKINGLKESGSYSKIISLLKQNRDISFLMRQYPDIDKQSLNQQKKAISSAFRAQEWGVAEQRIRSLHNDTDFLNYKAIKNKKANLVSAYEDSLAAQITRRTLANAKRFVEDNLTNTGDIESLYNHPAMKPVYTMTFSRKGPAALEAHKARIEANLDKIKYFDFPARAIEALYKQFSRDITNGGVARARAIVAHGKFYRGKSKKLRNLIAECDPTAAKWITAPKKYRKVFALPITSNQGAENEYMFKLNLRLPSKAKFPVFDVNVKLPKEIAADAAQNQWYESMKMNNKILKNEGRFVITAPTASNGYECQITPLQMKKDGNNVLEVRFKHNSFKVFEISIMAQRPIMKKN